MIRLFLWPVLITIGGWLYYSDTALELWLAPLAAALTLSIKIEDKNQPVHLLSAFIAASSIYLTPLFC